MYCWIIFYFIKYEHQHQECLKILETERNFTQFKLANETRKKSEINFKIKIVNFVKFWCFSKTSSCKWMKFFCSSILLTCSNYFDQNFIHFCLIIISFVGMLLIFLMHTINRSRWMEKYTCGSLLCIRKICRQKRLQFQLYFSVPEF